MEKQMKKILVGAAAGILILPVAFGLAGCKKNSGAATDPNEQNPTPTAPIVCTCEYPEILCDCAKQSCNCVKITTQDALLGTWSNTYYKFKFYINTEGENQGFLHLKTWYRESVDIDFTGGGNGSVVMLAKKEIKDGNGNKVGVSETEGSFGWAGDTIRYKIAGGEFTFSIGSSQPQTLFPEQSIA